MINCDRSGAGLQSDSGDICEMTMRISLSALALIVVFMMNISQETRARTG